MLGLRLFSRVIYKSRDVVGYCTTVYDAIIDFSVILLFLTLDSLHV